MLTKDLRYPSYLEHKGPYNVASGNLRAYDGRIWNVVGDPPTLTAEEFESVNHIVKTTASRYGSVNVIDRPCDFWVWEDKYFDRTQRIEVTSFTNLPRSLRPLVQDLMAALACFPLWRVMIDADVEDEVILVYPGAVRIDCAGPAESLEDTLERIAVNRFRRWQLRQEHRALTLVQLRPLIAQAFAHIDRDDVPVALVGSFPTLSSPFSDWRLEGQRQRSVWLLFRELRDYHDFEYTTDPESAIGIDAYWGLPDGTLLEWFTKPIPDQGRMVYAWNLGEWGGNVFRLRWGGREFAFQLI